MEKSLIMTAALRNAVLLMSLGAAMNLAAKKPEEPRQTFSKQRTFSLSCESMWPVTLPVFISNGWSVQSSDRAGGLLSLAWWRGEVTGISKVPAMAVSRYTTAPVSSFKYQWHGFRFVSATVLSVPTKGGCS